jgi:hypothetical protein
MITFKQLMGLTYVALSATVIAVGVVSPHASAGADPAVVPHSLATTWTVSPGGTFTGSAGTSLFQDTATGATVTCKSASLTGALKSGSGLAGKGLGKVTSLTFSKCSLDGVGYSLSSGTVDWSLNAVSYNATSNSTSGTIIGVRFTLSGANCSAVVSGTSGTAKDGTVKFRYTNKTGRLDILTTGGNLQVWDVAGCLGLFSNGDTSSAGTCPAVTPKQTLTRTGGPGREPRMTGPPC